MQATVNFETFQLHVHSISIMSCTLAMVEVYFFLIDELAAYDTILPLRRLEGMTVLVEGD